MTAPAYLAHANARARAFAPTPFDRCGRSPNEIVDRVSPLFVHRAVDVSESTVAPTGDCRWVAKTAGPWHEIIIPRRGGFAVKRAGGTAFVYSGVALVLAPSERYQIAYPAASIDTTVCSVYRVLEGSPPWPSEVRLDSRTYFVHRLALRAARAARAAREPRDAAAAAVAADRVRAAVDAIRAASEQRGPALPLRRESANRRAHAYVMRVREVIARRFLEHLDLGTVAAAVGCSRYHLSRIITGHEGAPVYRLIVRHRLRHALEAVLETTRPLATIALDSGFASQSHFGDAFRLEFGCAPGAVRRAEAASLGIALRE